MVIGNFFIIIFMNYYLFYFWKIIFNKKERHAVQATNKKLDELRVKKVKSLEEQKEFLNVRYPKSGKFKFTWKFVRKMILRMAIFFGLIRGWMYVFDTLNINTPLWLAIVVVMFGPILINFVLEKFNVQKTDWRVMFK